ncbi:hypothetical protein [Marinobacterium aestuariivivens]|uniref:Uncharacterized protein n=1 Tax=Marinobacterium aestuariivivens TaxID=1698799 RepID=A0ABW2A0X8_9GAMM
MEELIESALRGLLSIVGLLFRALVWLVVDVWIGHILWYLGWPAVRVLTWGRYPEVAIDEYDKAGIFAVACVSVAGVAVLMLPLFVLEPLFFTA